MAANLKARCSKCAEMQRSYLRTLEDKRTLLVKLQNEQEKSRKLCRDVEVQKAREQELLNRITASSTEGNEPSSITSTATTDESRLERQLSEAMTVNRKWRTDFQQLTGKHNAEMAQLRSELNQTQHRLEDSKTHVLTLETEVLRLAEALTEKQTSGLSRPAGSHGDLDLVKEQMQAYKDDFSCERRDRERAQSEKESLLEQLKSAQEIIATQTQEMELYRDQYERLQEENRLLLSRRQSTPNSVSQPQLQIVYPIGEARQQDQLEWRQLQRRRGVFTRGPTLPPPSAFYGGDVEVDTNGIHGLSNGYNTI